MTLLANVEFRKSSDVTPPIRHVVVRQPPMELAARPRRQTLEPLRFTSSGVGCLPRRLRRFLWIAISLYLGEIAAEGLQRKLLGIDLTTGANATATKHRNWRAPALNRVLKQERQNDAWNREEFPVHENAQNGPGERQRRSIHFQPPLDIPLILEFVDPAGQCRRRLPGSAHQPPRRISFDFAIHMVRGVRLHSVFLFHKRSPVDKEASHSQPVKYAANER